MSSRTFRGAAAGFALVALALVAARPALALPEDGQKFKDWTARCEVNPNNPAERECVIFQTVFETNNKKNIMNVVVAMPPNQPNGRVIVMLPLGVDLRPGIEFAVDDGQPTQYPYVICLKDGCQVHIPLETTLLNALKKGNKGIIRFRALPAMQNVAVPISFAGFTAAVNSLQ